MKEAELKNCPLCGGCPVYNSTIGIECSDCYLLMPVDDYSFRNEEDKKSDCAKSWNRRLK